MQIMNETLELVPLEAVRPHPRNPRRGEVAVIRASIAANGFFGAIVVQRSTGYILAGNHRWEAARQSGARSVPCLFVDVDDDAAVRILLADNRTSDLAGYDEAQLAELLRELADATGTLDGTGFAADDLQQLLERLERELDTVPAPDQSGELQSRFQILVDCRCEEQQRELLERLTADGYDCRALVA